MFKKFSLADYDCRAVIYFMILLLMLLFNYFLGDNSVIVGLFIFKVMFYIIYHLIFLYLKHLKSLDDSSTILLDKLDRFSRFDDFEVKVQTKSFDNQLLDDDLDDDRDGNSLLLFLLKYGFINIVLSFPIYLHLSLLFIFSPMSNLISPSENHFRLILISLSFLFELVALFVYHCFFKQFRN